MINDVFRYILQSFFTISLQREKISFVSKCSLICKRRNSQIQPKATVSERFFCACRMRKRPIIFQSTALLQESLENSKKGRVCSHPGLLHTTHLHSVIFSHFSSLGLKGSFDGFDTIIFLNFRKF